jgi:hypothetical protein
MSLTQNTIVLSKKRRRSSSIFTIIKNEEHKHKTTKPSFKSTLITLESQSQSDLNETFSDSILQTPSSHTSIYDITIPSFFNDKPHHNHIKETLEQYEKVVHCFDDEERELYLMRKESLLSDVTSASSNCDW